MSEKDKNKFEVNLIKTLSPERKKLLIVAPLIGCLAISIIYFVLFDGDTTQKETDTKITQNIDLNLPDSETKELSNNKKEVFLDLDEANKQQITDAKLDFDDVLEDPLGNEKKDDFVSLTREEEQLKKITNQLENIEKQNKSKRSTPVTTTSYNSNRSTYSTPKRSEPKLSEEEKREQYYESLRKERDARNKNKETSTDRLDLIEVRAVINNNQSVLPPARVELILDETLSIKGRTFQRGTPVLAQMRILNSRVMLDINNIQRVPISVVSVKDSYDGRKGLFSEVAEQIWRDYQDEQKDVANSEISDGIEKQTNSSIVGGAIDDLAGLFRKKRKRKYDKITLVNDHAVILKIDPNK